jgi:hypothetical protein
MKSLRRAVSGVGAIDQPANAQGARRGIREPPDPVDDTFAARRRPCSPYAQISGRHGRLQVSPAPGIPIESFGSICSTTRGAARIEDWSCRYRTVSLPSKRPTAGPVIERRDLLGGLVQEYERSA